MKFEKDALRLQSQANEWAQREAKKPMDSLSKYAKTLLVGISLLKHCSDLINTGSVFVKKSLEKAGKLMEEKSGKNIKWNNLRRLLNLLQKKIEPAHEVFEKLKSTVDACQIHAVEIKKGALRYEKEIKQGDNDKAAETVAKIEQRVQDAQGRLKAILPMVKETIKEFKEVAVNKPYYTELGELRGAMDKVADKKYVEIRDLKLMVSKLTHEASITEISEFLKGRMFAYGDIKAHIHGINENGQIGLEIKTKGVKDKFPGIKWFKIMPQAYLIQFGKQLVEMEHEMMKAQSNKRFIKGQLELESGRFGPIKSQNFLRIYELFVRFYQDKGLTQDGQLVKLQDNTPIRTLKHIPINVGHGMLRSKGLANELFKNVKIEHEFEGKKYIFTIHHFDERHVALKLEGSHEHPMGVLLDHDLPHELNKLTLIEKKDAINRKVAEIQPFDKQITNLDSLIEYLIREVGPKTKKWQLDEWGFTSEDIGVIRLIAKLKMQSRHSNVSRADHAKNMAA